MSKKATNNNFAGKKNPVDIVKNLVREGQLDEDTAKLFHDISLSSVKIREAIRGILENYRHILDAIATVRGSMNVVLDNVQDVENMAEQDD